MRLETMKPGLRPRRGIALITVLLVSLVIASLMVVGAMLSANSSLIVKYRERSNLLEWAANAGLEEARARINADKSLYPADGYTVLENDAVVKDANGDVIPNITRTLYVGPTGITSGQYGVQGSAVAVVKDKTGNSVVRRNKLQQESFAKYAYFTDNEGADIVFASGDQIYGPVHSNDYIEIHSTGATFFGPVSTAKTVINPGNGTFKQGYKEKVKTIPFPETADLQKLKTQATQGQMAITSTNNGGPGEATTRIEFVSFDLNGDNDSTDADEGFIRIYQSSDYRYVTAALPSDYNSNGLRNSLNCGDVSSSHSGSYKNKFMVADLHGTSGHDWKDATESGSKCYLGGDETLSDGVFKATDTKGKWLKWPGTVSPKLSAIRSSYGDQAYYWPIGRALNPTWKGVIYVDGNVAISGKVRGQVTLAATGNIAIVDDLQYQTDAGSQTCNDILGLFAGNDVVLANNTINAPQRAYPSSSYSYYSREPDKQYDEIIQAVILALDVFTAEDYDEGSTSTEKCDTKSVGRGCLRLTGGIIQNTRGAVGLTDGHGYVKRYSYDACAASSPPPYFPTTGHFVKDRYFEVDPTAFDIDDYFKLLTPAP